MKNNSNFKLSRVMLLLLVMVFSIGNVFAYNIEIFPKREYNNGIKSDVVFRLYESPHADTAKDFFQNKGKKPGEVIKVDNSDVYENKNPDPGKYATQRFLLSDEPLCLYPAGKDYGYITYISNTLDVQGSITNTPIEYINAKYIPCSKPIEKNNYRSHIITEIDAYDYDKVGAGSRHQTLLCNDHSSSNCNQEATRHTLASVQGIKNNVYKNLENESKGRTKKDSKGQYAYISKVLKVTSVKGRGTIVADTIEKYYNFTVPEGWADQNRGPNKEKASASIINIYDNKLYFPEPLEATIKIRYFDIANKDSNLDKRKTSFITLEKQDKSIFTKEDVDKMLIEEKEIPYTPGDCIEIPEKDGMVILGHNKTTAGQKDYSGKDKIVIGDINSTKICPTNEENSKDVYIDIFYNSKKRVYVRHINVTGKYNAATNEVVGLTPAVVANLERFHKTFTPFADQYVAKNNSYLGRINMINPMRGFEEEYNIGVKNYIEAHNILNVKRDYIGSKTAIDYNRTKALNKLNANYNGTIKFDNKGTNPNKAEDIRTFSAKEDEVTFIDMFYIINDDPKIPVNPDDKNPNDPIGPPGNPDPNNPENPGSDPSGGCEDSAGGSGAGNGMNLKPKGALYFESRLDEFKNSTENEFDKILKEDKIPSDESLYYGALDVYPYMMGTVVYRDNKGNVYVSNGKNMSKIPYNYRTLEYLGFYTIKDNVEVYDEESQKGGKLFGEGNILWPRLSDAYLNDVRNTKIDEGTYKVKVETEKREGGNEYYIDTFVEVSIYNDGLTFGKTNVLIPTYPKIYRKKIREDKYINKGNGNFVLDRLSTKYYTQEEVARVEEINHKSLVEEAVRKARMPKTIRDMNYLYKDNSSLIPRERFNGKRILSGRLQYEKNPAVSRNESCNINDTILDLHMNEANKNTEPVIVLTPVIANMNLKSGDSFVDHTENDVSGQILQRNTPFEVTTLTTGIVHPTYPRLKNYEKYTERNEIQFSFPLKFYKVYDRYGSIVEDVSTPVAPLTWIDIPAGGKIYTQAVYGQNDMANETNTLEGRYTLKVYATNSPKTDAFKQDARISEKDLSDERYNIVPKSHTKYHGLKLENEIKYLARSTKKTINLGRIYDFKITDVVDIDWKNVFRKDNAIDHTGTFYYSGISRWNMYSSLPNAMELRKDTEIGRNPQRVLPVGPKKHTNLNYAKAPKMGYKFAFDLKTTGKIAENVDKYIEIKPEYYYISKDGTKFYDSNKIDLYYMTAAKKYVKVGSSADNYKITMRPADGARYISSFETEFNKSNLSKDLISIGNLSKIKLTLDKNLVENEKNLVQLWYGEFKLPNSTIAVLKSNQDLEHPLKDGYIGVKFNITCVEKNDAREIILSYNKNNKNKPGVPNTSQWDYERYMKVIPEQPYDFGYRLEKGVWNITDSVYQKIKGTVMLYDTDEKAANDFEVGSAK